MKLTDAKVKAAKPREKAYRIPDGKGLFLQVNPNGSKWWRFRYTFDGKQNLLSLGVYPERTLKEAREDHFELRRQLAAGINPGEVRKAAKTAGESSSAESFEVIAREWHSSVFFKDVTAGHAKTTLRRLERDAFPWIGTRPIGEITPPELLAVLRRVESRGALETAHRVKTICGQVFRYAVATGRAERDPTADLKGVMPSSGKQHLAALTEPAAVAKLLKAIDGYEGGLVTRAALRLAPLVFVRPGELRHAEWSEIDLDAAEWNIPAEKMKTRQAHLVPLSRQAIEVLRDLEPVTKPAGSYVFPSARSCKRPMSENAVLAALRRMGYEKDEMTGHGFRAMARTMLDEILQFRPEIIEHQLAHTVKDALGRAYNRTQHLEERRKMMQVWADYLDGLKAGAKVIPISKGKGVG